MQIITEEEAIADFDRFLEQVEQGELFAITRQGKPVAMLSPPIVVHGAERPKLGELVDRRVKIAEDVFAPLTDDELKEWGL